MKHLLERPAFWALVIGVVAFAVYAASFADPTPFNHYVLLADALRHGHVDLGDVPRYLERTTFHGKHYVIPPPFPAVLLLPYVALRGPGASQSLASYVLGAVAASLMLMLAARLAPRRSDYLWLGVLSAFGTVIWYLAAVGSTWYFAHIVVVVLLTTAVLESLGKRRPLLMGLAIALCYLTRQTAVMVVPYFVLVTTPQWAPAGLRAWRQIDLGYLNRLAGPIAVALVLYGLYNWLRFGTFADVAAAWRPGILQEPWFERGLFHPSYAWRHLETMFTRLPGIVPTPPYLLIPWTGLAIWFTTPAFVYALRAPLDLQSLAAWSGILGVLAVTFMYGNPGISQFGYRFAVDVYPLAYLLAIRGMGGRPSAVAKGLILAGILVNLWGVAGARLGWIAP